MFELTQSAICKDVRFDQKLHPTAFQAATLHEAVLRQELERLSSTPVGQASPVRQISENKVHHIEKIHSRDLLKCYLRRLGVSTDPRILFDVTNECDFEIWSLNMHFIGCSHGFMKASSYSFQDLAERDWSELFSRHEAVQKQIVAAISWLMQAPESRRYVSNVTDWHFVKETSAQRHAIEIRVKSGGLAFDSTGLPQAIVAVTQLRPPSHS